MQLEIWQFIVGVGGAIVVQLVALTGAYYGLKADNARLSAELAIGMLTERSERLAGDATTKVDLMVLIATAERTCEDVSRRLQHVETGQDEWKKSLRERTHVLANTLHDLAIKVDRLERRRASDEKA